MGNLRVFSNIALVAAQTAKEFEAFPEGISKAVAKNAKVVLAESIVQIDVLLYSQPETPSYHRTKNLRRSNSIKQVGPMSWLVYNDARYAGPVHDGTSVMSPRPWMQTAIELKEVELEENLVNGGLTALRVGEQKAEPVPTEGIAVGPE